MNLFDILSAGKRGLNEENVSSFLAWILDPKQSHGCGSLFLNRLLSAVDEEKYQPWISKLQHISVDVLVEEEVVTKNGKRRYVDIVIVMSIAGENSDCDTANKTESIIFAIENKIRENACDKFQLSEEYEGLKEYYKEADISFLYLTPIKSARFDEAFSLLPDDLTKFYLTWTNSINEPNHLTVVSILRNILQDDLDAKINPLSSELKFVLKSFIVFAENGFRSHTNKTPVYMRRSRYYKDIAFGVEGVQELIEQQRSGKISNIYIGFVGGITALEKQTIN